MLFCSLVWAGIAFVGCVQCISLNTSRCAHLSDLTVSNATKITSASILPSASNFTGSSVETSYNVPQTDLPELCRVAFAFANDMNPGGLNAYDPDMRPFQDAGGKLIQYHGYADPLIPSLTAPGWYDTLNDFYQGIGKAGEVEDFYRLFLVPGMGHCSGRVGSWVIDAASQGGIVPAQNGSDHSMLWSLVDWVEGGGIGASSSAPETIIGTKFLNDTASLGIDFERPVCRWPAVAEFQGGAEAGSSSWRCPTAGMY